MTDTALHEAPLGLEDEPDNLLTRSIKNIRSGNLGIVPIVLGLIFIVVFIQKRPQGLFALKGRSAES